MLLSIQTSYVVAMTAGLLVAGSSANVWATSKGKCKCSNLRLAQNRYVKGGPQKYVRYSFKVGKGGDPDECVLVQLISGRMYDIYPDQEKLVLRGMTIDTIPKTFNSSWNGEIDSPDSDPVVWSTSSRRAIYKVAGKRKRWACDSPSYAQFSNDRQLAVVDDLQFEVRLYCASDVPKTVAGPEELPTPIASVTWEQSTCWQRGFKPTHPGFGNECVVRQRKPRRRRYKVPKPSDQCKKERSQALRARH